MAWQEFKRSLFVRNALSPNTARVRRSGVIVLAKAIIDEAGLADRAYLLWDPEAFRIGMRRPDPSETKDAVRIKPEGNQRSPNEKYVAVDCGGLFNAAGWLMAAEKRPGKKPRRVARFEGNRQVYVRAGTQDAPPLLVVKLGEDRDEIEEPAEED